MIKLHYGNMNRMVMVFILFAMRYLMSPFPALEIYVWQARFDSLRAAPLLPPQSIPKQPVLTNKSVTTDQSSAVDGHSVSKVRRDVQVTAGPHTSQTQKPSVHPVTGMPMQIQFHQSHIPAQFGGPNPQLQSQSMVNSSMPIPMPMTMPFPMGNHPQVQQVYFQGLPPHMLQPHGVMHQGQSANFTSQMGTQLPHLGNIGMNINPQFSQQSGEFGNGRKTVKITHPHTREELSLVKKADASIETGSSGSQSQPNVPPQSQPITIFPPGPYSQGSIFLPGPNSLPLTSIQIAPSSQAPRLNNQVWPFLTNYLSCQSFSAYISLHVINDILDTEQA